MGNYCSRSPDPHGDGCLGKKAWPELVGKKAEVAVMTIQSENSRIDNIAVVREKPPGLHEVQCCNRVFLVVDAENTVVETPSIG
ncbi:putative proteinase inhibitor I-B [Cocos nucifera]|uniref:Proteinase inhibitor n=1 Tax=Cocos nucifera TaxID=13894 RepID=A0A8K0ITL0_COCNU|nr:putative proteinase inhibitor I-B [Cocos nucifera]